MQVCPIDLRPCCDDICYGAGCLRGGGEDMIQICHLCHKPVIDGECDCPEGEPIATADEQV